MKTMKFRDMEVLYKGNRKMLLFNQFDLGAKYEIYTLNDGCRAWSYSISFSTLSEAKAYYDKIYA